MDGQLFDALNQSALVVVAGLGVWLVKVVVNDLKHDVADIKELLQDIKAILAKQ